MSAPGRSDRANSAGDGVTPRRAPYVTDDAAISVAAADIAALEARVGAATGRLKERLAAAGDEIAARARRLLDAERSNATLAREMAAAEAETRVQWQRAENWRKDFYASNRMLIAELDRVAQRVIEAAAPDASADAAAPTVSIVMPVWNRADVIGTAIKSVLAQSFRGWELIVIDDGSTDDLAAALRPFLADPRIRVMHQSNAGECPARNRGLGLVRGELIAYLDSDNFWYPDFLDAAVRVFRADPALEIAYGGISYEWPNGDVRFYLLPYERAALLRDNLADMNVIVHRRRAYERYGGFDETLKRAVEWDLMLRYTVDTPAAQIPVVGARYRILDKNRVSNFRALAPSVFRIRRKWWPRPAPAPRVLYVVFQFPQLSESHIYVEIACMRRFGAVVEVWAPIAGAAPFEHDLTVHRGTLAEAIRAFDPDLLHVHWFTVVVEHFAALAAADLPITVRGHSFDATPDRIRRALDLPRVRRLDLLPGSASPELPADARLRFTAPIFDTTLFAPAASKDRKLVLRASAGRFDNGIPFMVELARRLPHHRVVLAIARATGYAAEADAIVAMNAEAGSPLEILIDVPRPEMAALFGAAGIYVHTLSAPERTFQKPIGGPVSVAEAMSTGAYVLVRDAPTLRAYVGNAGAAYRDADHAAELVRATESWTDDAWQAARVRSIERAFTHHADELVLRPLFDEWCAIAGARAAPRLDAPHRGETSAQ